jgi:hypothetical protein
MSLPQADAAVAPTGLRRNRPTALTNRGEYYLLVAMLQDAINCVRKHASARGKRERQLFEEAVTWIMAEGDTGTAFSFEQVCGVLGLDPGYLRGGLRHWLEAAGRFRQVHARIAGTSDSRRAAQ